MANHKWNDTTVLKGIQKTQKCKICGINRNWCYGDFQCWEYWWLIPHINQNGSAGHTMINTFKRPECVGKKNI
jgi:hypothetical protein